MKKTKDFESTDHVEIKDGVVTESTLEKDPKISLPPLEDIVANLGFWLHTAIIAGNIILKSKENAVSESNSN